MTSKKEDQITNIILKLSLITDRVKFQLTEFLKIGDNLTNLIPLYAANDQGLLTALKAGGVQFTADALHEMDLNVVSYNEGMTFVFRFLCPDLEKAQPTSLTSCEAKLSIVAGICVNMTTGQLYSSVGKRYDARAKEV